MPYAPTLSRALLALIVSTQAALSQSTPEWTLTEAWRVGGEVDGPLSFDANIGLAALPNGGIAHLDWKAKRLHILDARGRPVRSVGLRGRQYTPSPLSTIGRGSDPWNPADHLHRPHTMSTFSGKSPKLASRRPPIRRNPEPRSNRRMKPPNRSGKS